MAVPKFKSAYSETRFWDKVRKYALVAGRAVLEPALKMYYATLDAATPMWAKTVIYAALGYFVSPVDAVPDVLPVVGYTDDLGILLAAAATVAAHITHKHSERALYTIRQWFNV